MLKHSELLELKRWNTPTIFNGWEQITNKNIAREGINIESTVDFMPQMGPMIGRAVTLKIEPSNPEHRNTNIQAWSEYRKYIASIPGPKVVVVQDLDKPQILGSFWGEVNANVHRALGCVGTITDGAIRDLDEMCSAGFKAIAQRLCVGHAFVCPVEWNVEVEVFGQKVAPKQLIHADKHGFLAIPAEDEGRLLEAARFMDSNECKSIINAVHSTAGQSIEDILEQLDQASIKFSKDAKLHFGKNGEW
ncbi:MAG: RraA family protein [Saprospiraceae bacterium]